MTLNDIKRLLALQTKVEKVKDVSNVVALTGAEINLLRASVQASRDPDPEMVRLAIKMGIL